MPKPAVTPSDLATAEKWLKRHAELSHIRLRKRADTLVLESGSADDPEPRARVRRLGVGGLWSLDMRHHTRWDPTPFRDKLEPLLEMVRTDFGWTLMPLE